MSLSSNFPTIKPSLNLDFANVGALDPRITFTRATTATYTNSLGLIATAASGVARFDYDPTTLAPRGLLIEEARTNRALYSEQFDNANWTKSACTVTANSATAPDGTVTADTLTATGSNCDLYTSTSSGAGTYTQSFYVKRKTGTGQIQFVTADGGRANVTQTITSTAWTRITYTETATLSNTFLGLRIVTSGDELYIWGAQQEAGSFATSYIPTVASTVTRNADVASINTLTPWFNAAEGTLYVETVSKNVLGTSKLPAALNSAAYATNSISPFIYSTARLRLLIYAGGVVTGDMYPATVYSDNQTIKLGAAYKVNDFALSANGATPTTDTSGDVPTGIDRLDLGATAGLTTFSGWLNRVAYYPARLTNAQLQSLTS